MPNALNAITTKYTEAQALTAAQQPVFVDNILAVYAKSTEAERLSGWEWYESALTSCKKLAGVYDCRLSTVVGVVAALSPNNKWQRNIVNAEHLIHAYMAGEAVESVKVSTYHAMRNKAWDILTLGTDHDMKEADMRAAIVAKLRGQKITTFYQNIIGERGSCTIDGHARNIAHNEVLPLAAGGFTIGKRAYKDLQAAYALAATKLTTRKGVPMTTCALQAITWVAWRRINGIV